MGRIAFLLLALFAEMEGTFTAERAAHARAAEAAGRRAGRPKGPGSQPWQDRHQDRLPKMSLHRYLLSPAAAQPA